MCAPQAPPEAPPAGPPPGGQGRGHTGRFPIATAAALAAISVAVVAPGAAAAANPDLAEAKRLYRELRYDEAVVKATRALERPGNSVVELAQAYELLGMAYAVLNDPASAARAFDRLLALDPEHRLPSDTSPKLADVLEQVRRDRAVRPSLELLGTRAVTDGVAVEARLADQDRRAARVLLLARQPTGQGAGVWRERELACDEEDVCRGTTDAPGGGELQFYVEARDGQGRTLAQVASPDAPMQVVLVRPDDAWYEQWWVWAAVGLAAGGAAAVLLAGSGQDEPAPASAPSGSWGTIRF